MHGLWTRDLDLFAELSLVHSENMGPAMDRANLSCKSIALFNCLHDYNFMFNVVFHTVIEFLNETRFFRFFPLCIVSVIRKQIAYGTKDPSSNQDMSSFLNQIFVRLKQVLGFSKKFFTYKFINHW